MTDEMDDGRRATFTARPMVRLLALVLLTFLAYLPALRAGYIWDDDAYVTENVLLHDAHGLSRIWFDIGATPQYYPLTFTSFWLEYQAWGLKPAGYHVVNVALHAAGAVLLVGVLLRLGVRGAWVAGFVFALHPVMVESVAWITERKIRCRLRSRWGRCCVFYNRAGSNRVNPRNDAGLRVGRCCTGWRCFQKRWSRRCRWC